MTATIMILIYLNLGLISDLPKTIYNSSIYTQDSIIEKYTNKEHKCLSEAMYFESRGEPKKGIFAVGNVIMYRVESDKFPNTICGVINQKGQFSYKHDKISDIPHNKKKYKEIQLMALDIMNGRIQIPYALFYHNTTVKPKWTKVMKLVIKIDNHKFYDYKGENV